MHKGEIRYTQLGAMGAEDAEVASGLPSRLNPGRYTLTFSAKDWVNTGEVPWSPKRLADLRWELQRRGINTVPLAARQVSFETHGGWLRDDDYYADFTFEIDLEVLPPTNAGLNGLGIEPISTSVLIIVICVAAVLIASVTLLSIKEIRGFFKESPVGASISAGVILAGIGAAAYFLTKKKSGGP